MKVNDNKNLKHAKLNEAKLQSQGDKKEEVKLEQKESEKKIDKKKDETLKQGKAKLEDFLKEQEIEVRQAAPRKGLPIKNNPLNPKKPLGNGTKINKGTKINNLYMDALQKAVKEAIINHLDETYRSWNRPKQWYCECSSAEGKEMKDLYKQYLAENLSVFISKIYPDGYGKQ